MTTLITISSLIIGAIFGAWWQHHRGLKDKRILANRNIDLIEALDGVRETQSKAIDKLVLFQKENEALKFQIQQHNIGRDEIKFTKQNLKN